MSRSRRSRKQRRNRRFRSFITLVLILAIITGISLALNNNRDIEEAPNAVVNNDDTDNKNTDIDKEDHRAPPIEEDPEPIIVNASLLAVGDIMFHSPQVSHAFNKETGLYDYNENFTYVKKYIQEADLSIGNFETVTAGEDREYSGYPTFNSPDATLDAIKNAGFNILSTANNHSLDRGKSGLLRTLEEIEKRGLKSVGTYKEKDTPTLVEDVNGIKIGFLSYTYGLNGLDSRLTSEELTYMVNLIDEEKIEKDIKNAKDLDLDIVVVFIHWGNEYQREASQYQRDLAQKMVEWGANIILGSHPHVIQEAEIIKYNGRDNFVIYSMGNFLSNQREETMGNKYTEDGIIVQIELEKKFDEGTTIIKDFDFIPTWVHRYWDNNRLKYEILPIADFLNDEELYSSLSTNVIKRITESIEHTESKLP